MRIPRFRIRTLLIAVAGVAVLLGANDLRQKAARYHSLRITHEWEGRACLSSAAMHATVAAANEREVARLRAAPAPDPTGLLAQINGNIAAQAAVERAAERRDRARARFHAELGRKYRRAAARPWRAVPPDPPPPE